VLIGCSVGTGARIGAVGRHSVGDAAVDVDVASTDTERASVR
jgi:hypothetical protein